MILDKFRIEKQVAVVTGGTKGIGKAIALALAEAGADIAVVSRTPHQDIERSVLSLGRRYVHHAADLTKREETKAVIPALMEKMGDVNIVIDGKKTSVSEGMTILEAATYRPYATDRISSLRGTAGCAWWSLW